ncbi:transposase [Bradyrhizobium sp. IC3069]|nr:transposase [Bradyrhizobium sp. IC4059]MCA1518368.1 transposase [Bradyrhizobium sp. IC3069]
MHIGAETGTIAIFHTRGQPLTHHPHAHCLVARQRAGLPLMEAGLASAPASSFRSGSITITGGCSCSACRKRLVTRNSSCSATQRS